jgi:hypothetical protein
MISQAARAGSPLEEAERLMGEARFKEALMLVNRLLESPKSGPEVLAPAFRIRGLCLAGQGRTKRSIKAFQRFLAIKPSYRLPKSTSPKMRWPFYKALSMPGQEPISLVHEPPEAPGELPGFPLKADVGTNPFDMVRSVRLKYQLARGDLWMSLSEPLEKPGQIVFPLPAGSEDKQVWYYFEAVNRHGGTLARAGGSDKPFHLQCAAEPVAEAPKPEEKAAGPAAVPSGPGSIREKPKTKPKPKLVVEAKPQPPPVVPMVAAVSSGPGLIRGKKPVSTVEEKEDDRAGPWYTTWWFWTAVGVVTAGVVTGVVLGVSGNGDSNEMIYDVYLE